MVPGTVSDDILDHRQMVVLDISLGDTLTRRSENTVLFFLLKLIEKLISEKKSIIEFFISHLLNNDSYWPDVFTLNFFQ